MKRVLGASLAAAFAIAAVGAPALAEHGQPHQVRLIVDVCHFAHGGAPNIAVPLDFAVNEPADADLCAAHGGRVLTLTGGAIDAHLGR